MLNLGQIATSDYNLLGAISEEELLGAIERASLNERKQFVRKIQAQTKQTVAAGTGTQNSRGEFEKRLHWLPKEIQQGLAGKTLQAVDAAYYTTKSIATSKIVKMLKDDDNKIVGQCNISSAKLEKGNIMLLAGIILLAGISGVDRGAAEVNYDILPDFIRNGEFEFKANGTTLIPSTSCDVFNTTGMNIRKGLFVMDNPKVILDQQAMELNIEWGANAPANMYMKAILIGTSVTKY
ncbi:MAG: hypothetical protein A2W93_12155 [Bacteroidetes bacterium GWF2_43_63]|nr:MAG: hypothetical protein A2W94_15645 [Bacteroidetes bacterium GWE2_42_42]OFY56375.1 MAG: hypothetical protein A2W93_12155 [Bacteroidetes bacterium GWF2_43_63]HBG69659.1 hypothetical protein [Bacteroidales bacterium]HCB61926.1 hypothetical protein [Bacteroidales bacterium]HCY42295.1 hypothetical protein [Prolixibacteraceae bacterium]